MQSPTTTARRLSRTSIVAFAAAIIAALVLSLFGSAPAHADTGDDWPTFVPGVTSARCVDGGVTLHLQKPNDGRPVEIERFRYDIEGGVSLLLGAGDSSDYVLVGSDGQPAVVPPPADGRLDHIVWWRDGSGVEQKVGIFTSPPLDTCEDPDPDPEPAPKPAVDCPELTKVVPSTTGTVRCSVKNASTAKLGGKSYRVVGGYAYLRLGAGNYRLSATNSAGTAYDDFRVVKYAAPTTEVVNAKKGIIKLTVSYPKHISKWEDGNSKCRSFGKDHRVGLTKAGSKLINTPNVKAKSGKKKTNCVRITVDPPGPYKWVKHVRVTVDRRPHS